MFGWKDIFFFEIMMKRKILLKKADNPKGDGIEILNSRNMEYCGA